MSGEAACEVCGAAPAFDTLQAILCACCIECQASLSPDVFEWRGKSLARGTRERIALLTIANWLRRCRLQPRARR